MVPSFKIQNKSAYFKLFKILAYSSPSGKTEGTLHPIPKGNSSGHVTHWLEPIDRHCVEKKYIFIVDAFSKYVKYATKT